MVIESENKYGSAEYEKMKAVNAVVESAKEREEKN